MEPDKIARERPEKSANADSCQHAEPRDRCRDGEELPAERLINDHSLEQPAMITIRMAHQVINNIMNSVGSQPPESGGILLGPVGTDEVTEFYFDQSGTCSGATYSPDHVSLMRKMKEEWLPTGIDMKGFVHSHPGRLDWLTGGDLRYINRLLDKNEDMEMFIAPVVIPCEFRLRPMVVVRKRPRIAQEASFEFF
jgi:proteasome lid subunit RPN8/RPN11